MVDHAVTIVCGHKEIHLGLGLRVGKSIFHLVLDQVLARSIGCRVFLGNKGALDLLSLSLYHLGLFGDYHRGAHLLLIRILFLLLQEEIEATTSNPSQRTPMVFHFFNIFVI